jgi:metal-responsive CopG/Arc/MetJ family transcriptional regulator
MKTAVSIPDDVFEDAERLAKALKKSRSELYSHALREYVARHATDRITEAVNRLSAEVDPDSDFSTSAARRTLQRSSW